MKKIVLTLLVVMTALGFANAAHACQPNVVKTNLGELQQYVHLPRGIASGRWMWADPSCNYVQMFLIPNQDGLKVISDWGPSDEERDTTMPEAVATKLFPANLLARLPRAAEGGRVIKGRVHSPERLNSGTFTGLDLTVMPGFGILAVAQKN